MQIQEKTNKGVCKPRRTARNERFRRTVSRSFPLDSVAEYVKASTGALRYPFPRVTGRCGHRPLQKTGHLLYKMRQFLKASSTEEVARSAGGIPGEPCSPLRCLFPEATVLDLRNCFYLICSHQWLLLDLVAPARILFGRGFHLPDLDHAPRAGSRQGVLHLSGNLSAQLFCRLLCLRCGL